MLQSFKSFRIGQKFRIQIDHINGIKKYTEIIYCEFKSCSYDKAGDPKELVVDQIIEIDKLVAMDTSYMKVERKLILPRSMKIFLDL